MSYDVLKFRKEDTEIMVTWGSNCLPSSTGGCTVDLDNEFGGNAILLGESVIGGTVIFYDVYTQRVKEMCPEDEDIDFAWDTEDYEGYEDIIQKLDELCKDHLPTYREILEVIF